MPQYQFTSPEGKSISFEYDGQVTESMLDELFARPEVADRPLTDVEFSRKFDIDKQKDFEWGKVAKGVVNAPFAIGGMFIEAAKQLPQAASKKGAKTALQAGKYGTLDTVNLAKDIWGETGDLFVDHEEEKIREYDRYIRNYNYNKKRQALKESGEVLPDLFEAGTIIADATNLIPGLGLTGKAASLSRKGMKLAATSGAKALEKGRSASVRVPFTKDKRIPIGTKGIVRASSKPRRMVESAAENISKSTGGEIGKGSLWGLLAGGISATPVAPAFWTAVGLELPARGLDFSFGAMSDVLKAAGRDGQKRFLDRIASDPDIFTKAPKLKEWAEWASAHGGTRMGDAAFNAMVDGSSLAVIQGLMTAAAGRSEEEIGQAIGTGGFMGGAIGATMGKPGAGGDIGLFKKDGVTPTARSLVSVDNYAKNIHDQKQKKFFNELSPQYKTAVGFFDEIGAKTPGRSTEIVEGHIFNDLAADMGYSGEKVAFFDPDSNKVFLNKEAPKDLSGEAAVKILADRYAVDSVRRIIRSDETLISEIVDKIKDENGTGYSFLGKEIGIKKEFQDIVNDHNSKAAENRQLSTINDVVNHIAAESLAQYITSDRNLGKLNQVPLLRILRNTSTSVLRRLGVVDEVGNPTGSKVAKQMLKSKAIRDIFKNHVELKNKTQKSISETKGGTLSTEEMLKADGHTIRYPEPFNSAEKKQLAKESKNYNFDEKIVGNYKDGTYGYDIPPVFRTMLEQTKKGKEGLDLVLDPIIDSLKENREIEISRYHIGKKKYERKKLLPLHIVHQRNGDLSLVALNRKKVEAIMELLIGDGLLKSQDVFWKDVDNFVDAVKKDPTLVDRVETTGNLPSQFSRSRAMIALVFGGNDKAIRDPELIGFKNKWKINDASTFERAPYKTITSVKLGEIRKMPDYKYIYEK